MKAKSVQRRIVEETSPGQRITVVACSLILAQLVFRGWAIYGGWYFADDLEFLYEAPSGFITWRYLLHDHAGHFMPGGFFVVWVVTKFGLLTWAAGATVIVLVQAAASIACFHMLRVLFGVRGAIIPIFAVYLFSSMSLPGILWWASALLTGPLTIALFLTVSTSVTYFRSPTWKRAVVLTSWIWFGLLFYEKSALLMPLVAYLALAYFVSGPPLARLRVALSRYRHSLALLAATGVAYVAVYLSQVERPLGDSDGGSVWPFAQNLVGTSFMTGLVGGPLRWARGESVLSTPNPPPWLLHVSWVALTLVILTGVLTRVRTGRAWILLGGYLGVTVLLLASARGTIGAVLGLEYRYLTEASALLCLVLGVVFLDLEGAPGSSNGRKQPLLRLPRPRLVVAGAAVVVCIFGVCSSITYSRPWHDNPARSYLATATREIDAAGVYRDLAQQSVPTAVMSLVQAPYHQSKVLVGRVAANARFPDHTDALFALDGEGHLQVATLTRAGQTLPGPRPGCGYLLKKRGLSLDLDNDLYVWSWWMQIGYLASADTPFTVKAGSRSVSATMQKGLHTLFVYMPGGYDRVELSGFDDAVPVCVDKVRVGEAIAGADTP